MEINYGTFAMGQGKKEQGPVLASVDGRVSSLGGEEVVFLDTATNDTHVMTRQVLEAMDACREFRPLDQHVANVAGRVDGMRGKETAVRQVLLSLEKRGLLVSDVDFLASFRNQPESEASADAPSTVFIRACDRPEQLQRLCATLGANEQAHSAGHRYVVVDDSTDAAASKSHAAMLDALATETGVRTAHIEQKGWRRVSDALAKELPEHRDSVHWLLQRPEQQHATPGGGIGRNLISLLSAGSKYALLDDDFQLPLRRHPAFKPGLDVRGMDWGMHTYASRDEALSGGEALARDPLDFGLAFCGQPVGRLGEVDAECALDVAALRGLSPSRTPMLKGDAFVASTINGHRGDPGSGRLTWLFLLDEAARAEFTGSRERYLDTLSQPGVWYGARRFLVSDTANFTAFGIDGTRMMPCTVPHQRGEDALFGSLVRLMYPNSVALNLPYAIGHRQEGRRDRGDWLDDPESPGMAICLADLARNLGTELVADSPAQRLAGMAARLRDLSDADDSGLGRYINEFLAYRRSLLIDTLQRVMANAKSPPVYWAADVRRMVEANGKALIERPPIRFTGCPRDWDDARTLRWFREESLALANALDAWPAMWEVARVKRENWLEWRG
ncbi:MAG: hypothetical protein R3F22_09825 [Lysobacteraceae bacterium]